MDAWGVWMKKVGPALVDMGTPVGGSAHIKGKAGSSSVGGYSMVEAGSLDAAKRLFDGHPHLAAPGSSIEILELVPMQM